MPDPSPDTGLMAVAASMCDVLGSDLADSPVLMPGLPADLRLVAETDGVVLDLHVRKDRPSLVDAMASDLRAAQASLVEVLVTSSRLSSASRREIGAVVEELGRLQAGLTTDGCPSGEYFCDPADVSPLTRPDVMAVPKFLDATAGLLRSGAASSFPHRSVSGAVGAMRMDAWFSRSDGLCPAEVMLLKAGDLVHDVRSALGSALEDHGFEKARAALELLELEVRYGSVVIYGAGLTSMPASFSVSGNADSGAEPGSPGSVTREERT